MVLTFKCTACGHGFDVAYVPSPVDGRPDAVRPARHADRSRCLTCEECGAEAAWFDDAAYWSTQGPPAYVPSPLAWMEAHTPARAIDMAAGIKTRRGTSAGLQRVIPGLPGREGGLSKREV